MACVADCYTFRNAYEELKEKSATDLVSGGLVQGGEG